MDVVEELFMNVSKETSFQHFCPFLHLPTGVPEDHNLAVDENKWKLMTAANFHKTIPGPVAPSELMNAVS